MPGRLVTRFCWWIAPAFAVLTLLPAPDAIAGQRLHAPEMIPVTAGTYPVSLASGDVDGDGIPEIAMFSSDQMVHVFKRISGLWTEAIVSTVGSTITNPPNLSPTVRFTNEPGFAPGVGFYAGQFLFNGQAPGIEIVSLRCSTVGVWSEQVLFGPMGGIANNGAFSVPGLLYAGNQTSPKWRIAVPGGDPFDPPIHIFLPAAGEALPYASLDYSVGNTGYCEQGNSTCPDAVIGNFNGDAINEVAVLRPNKLWFTDPSAAPYGGQVWCWPFEELPLTTTSPFAQLVAGRLDGGPTTDLVVRAANGKLQLLFGHTGQPPFSFQLGSITSSVVQPAVSSGVVSADLDHDGDLDLVQAYNAPPGYEVLLNNGAGAFTSSFVAFDPSVGSVTAITVADMDGDGNQDVVLGQPVTSPPRLLILPGLGDGTFGMPPGRSLGTLEPSVVATADFNADGALDLAIGGLDPDFSDGAQDFQVFLNQGAGTFGVPQVLNTALFVNYYAGARKMIAYRHDNTDPSDPIRLAALQYSGEGEALGNGDGTLQPMVFNYNVPFSEMTGMDRADLDGDGTVDRIWIENDHNGNSSLNWDVGAGTSMTGITGDYSGVRAVDWNGDGFLDFITFNRTQRSLDVVIQDPLQPLNIDSIESYPINIAPVQYGDHAAPFLVLPSAGSGTGITVVVRGLDTLGYHASLQVFRNQPPYAGEIYDVATSPASFLSGLAAGDVDGDGITDLVVGEVADAMFESYVTLMRGLATSPITFERNSTFVFANQAINDLALGDITGDGRLDLISLSSDALTNASVTRAPGGYRASRVQQASTGAGQFASVIALPLPLPTAGVGGPSGHSITPGSIAMSIWPNPIRARSGQLAFTLPAAAHVVADLVDISGRRMRRLIDADRTAGTHTEYFRAVDEAGHELAGGVYFLSLRAGSARTARAVVMLK